VRDQWPGLIARGSAARQAGTIEEAAFAAFILSAARFPGPGALGSAALSVAGCWSARRGGGRCNGIKVQPPETHLPWNASWSDAFLGDPYG
jgi:hypothetical protein